MWTLGAEELIGAEKGGRSIAVEIKSFRGESEVNDLEKALGQFALYRTVLAKVHPGWMLFLAVPDVALQEVFDEPLERLVTLELGLQVFGFDPVAEVITRWIP